MCVVCSNNNLDPATLDAFGGRLLDYMNGAAIALMMSVGHRTGLYETMKQMPAPATSDEVAEAAKLNERYVREWLGAMAAAKIVEVDATGNRYHLPQAHAAMLTKGGEGECMAHMAQYIGVLGGVEDRVVDCFRNGGGVPYSAYPRFHEVMAEDSGQSVLGALFSHILPLVPGLTASLVNGIRVLDCGCGRGMALILMAARFPRSEFVGYDLSEEAIEWARSEAEWRGLKNLRFEVRDLSDFDETAEPNEFDLVTTFDAIHDQARPDRLLGGIRRTLKPDGVFLAQDIGVSSNVAENTDSPIGPLIYAISCMHCMTVSLAQGGLGLGAAWGEQQTMEFIRNAGFNECTRHALEHDIQNYYYVCRP